MVLGEERFNDVVVASVRRDVKRGEVLHPGDIEAAGEAALAGVQRPVAVAAVAAAETIPAKKVNNKRLIVITNFRFNWGRRGSHSTVVEFALHAQWPQVRFKAFT